MRDGWEDHGIGKNALLSQGLPKHERLGIIPHHNGDDRALGRACIIAHRLKTAAHLVRDRPQPLAALGFFLDQVQCSQGRGER